VESILGSLGKPATEWPIVPAAGDCDDDGEFGGMKKPKYADKTCPSATLSTTNPTRPDPGLNPGRRGGKPAINRLSFDTANGPIFISILNLPKDGRSNPGNLLAVRCPFPHRNKLSHLSHGFPFSPVLLLFFRTSLSLPTPRRVHLTVSIRVLMKWQAV
jgi:hypothetical protein